MTAAERHAQTARETLLSSALAAAGPLWIERLRPLTWAERAERARACAQVIAEKGDVILFRTSQRGATAEAFNRLAEGIACLAFAPGGVRVLGVRFEARGQQGASE